MAISRVNLTYVGTVYPSAGVVTITIPTTTAGNALLVAIENNSTAVSGADPASVTHAGQAMTKIGSSFDYSRPHWTAWGLSSIGSTGTTITFTLPDYESPRVFVLELSGADSTTAFVSTTTSWDGGYSTSPWASGTLAAVTLSGSGSLFAFETMFYGGALTSKSASNSFVEIGSFSGDHTLFARENVAAGSYGTTLSLALASAGTFDYPSALLVGVNAASGGGGGSTYSNTLPDAGSPNDCKITCSQALANVATFPRSLTFGPVTMTQSLSAGLLFANSISYSATLGFSQTVAKRVDQSLSFSTTLSQALASAATFPRTTSDTVTLSHAATALSVFPRVLTFGPVTFAYSMLIGTFDQLNFNMTLSQSLSTTKQTSAAMSFALTLNSSLSSTAAISNALQFAISLAQQLASVKTTSAALSSTVQLGYTVTGVVPNTTEHTMTASFFGFVPMMTASLALASQMSADDLETEGVMSADDFKGDVQ